ncbi:hypothetical protein QTP70_022773 [Hemibagrus guttatus]|uniref:Fibronectin type-III domain-containing protein n=1 Tax=Hemibagrus guttatus TaxID=175788 RepID=A0AAE0PZT7_9TELE|nr:hypothetical protein QTP70_022773 [Hemibagrus guttatus]
MRLCELLVTLSLVLIDVNGDDTTELMTIDVPDSCSEERATVIQTMDNENHINSSISEIQCEIYNENILNCSWSTDSLPEDAQYSASLHFYDRTQSLYCVSESSKKVVKCQGTVYILNDDDMSVEVNITINGYWYIICQNYEPVGIEILSPPQNITALKKSGNLEIQWLQTRSCCSKQNKCFNYEVEINNETVKVDFKNTLAYNLTNFEPTSRYTIRIRTKQLDECGGNSQWSDWSRALVVNPLGDTYQLNAGVIASIVFVLPMILLAFLLVCKFQRLFDKLFPSIPNPSRNVQMILEKNYYNQDMPPKQCEEGAEILEVIG